jgi:hypothetical protein
MIERDHVGRTGGGDPRLELSVDRAHRARPCGVDADASASPGTPGDHACGEEHEHGRDAQ